MDQALKLATFDEFIYAISIKPREEKHVPDYVLRDIWILLVKYLRRPKRQKGFYFYRWNFEHFIRVREMLFWGREAELEHALKG